MRQSSGLMLRVSTYAVAMLAVFLVVAYPAQAQQVSADRAAETSGQAVVSCVSDGGQKHCAADTSRGVVLIRSIGSAACILGRSWGYDETGVWVKDGCGGEFQVAPAIPAAPVSLAETTPKAADAETPTVMVPKREKPAPRIESWGEFEPGDGFLIGRNKAGELALSGYALVRYIGQNADSDTFTDHLGNERPVDGRQDVYPHRIMIFLKGWMGNQKLVYNIFFWTVNTTDQKNILASFGYQFSRAFSLYAGVNGLPGTRSLQGSHPYWLGHDRVMADEFFRPYFTNGLWAQGEPVPGLWYSAMIGNNLSILGVKATQLDRKASGGASLWWMPTTKEFGPKGAYGDFEWHDTLATRFGASMTFSPEQRFTDANTSAPGNTSIRLADSINVFDAGALANGVTVDTLDYQIVAVDAGMKYRGVFLQTELYDRVLDKFRADGPLPVTKVHDQGFYVQAAFYPLPKKLELYAATSQIFGDSDAGFDNSHEYLVGANLYPFGTRDNRLNVQWINVDHSPVNSTFGYYTGGQKGNTLSVAYSIFF